MEEIPVTKGSLKMGSNYSIGLLTQPIIQVFGTSLKTNPTGWRQSLPIQEEAYVGHFLGRMLFHGEESFQKCSVFQGGEKVRCMISKMMLQNPKLVGNGMSQQTTLTWKSITAFNNGDVEFMEPVLNVLLWSRFFVQSFL